MKRAKHLFEKVISKKNLKQAVMTVADSHRWRKNHKPNRIAGMMALHADEAAEEVRQLIINGWENSPTTKVQKWDRSAHKWREISIPRLFPDQVVHHAVIQVLEPVMMKHMDYWCLSSVKGRGCITGVKAIKKWMKNDIKGTKYCAELDIHHFYDTIAPEMVLDRFKALIKDDKMLDLIGRVVKDGVLKGVYCSQWFANTLLQPMDALIRSMGVKHYIRYMDNITLFDSNKRRLKKITIAVDEWLAARRLTLNPGGVVFETSKRLPNALGFRYGRSPTKPRKYRCFTLIRKHRLLTIKQMISRFKKLKYIRFQFAASLMSRMGGFIYASCVRIIKRCIPNGTKKTLRKVIREHTKKEVLEWNTFLEQLRRMGASWSPCGQKGTLIAIST